MSKDVCRFAPTASGRAHPGTLLAALLAWLDARSRGARFLLRVEDIDRDRVTEAFRTGLVDDLEWFGLDWDELSRQSGNRSDHEAALDSLAAKGRLYACSCTRSVIKAAGLRSADGGYLYPGTCRRRRVADWRSCPENLRCELSDFSITLKDEGGLDCSQDISSAMGDPLLRRADGSVTYQLAVVADDAASGVTRIVRGRDIAPSTATQAVLYTLLERPLPVWRHHLLLLETRGGKFSKFHQAVGADTLRNFYAADTLCGILAHAAGLLDKPEPVTPEALLSRFAWERVRRDDAALKWNGEALRLISSNHEIVTD
jgi:glutamyl/glutaminyl-tRNA synthetase